MQEAQETWIRFLDWEDPLETEMATHSSILAWKIPWTEESGGPQSPWGYKELDMTEQGCTHTLPSFMWKTPLSMLISLSPSCLPHRWPHFPTVLLGGNCLYSSGLKPQQFKCLLQPTWLPNVLFFFLIYIVFGVEALSYVYWVSDVLFLKSNFIYLLLTALGLCCFARAFSSSESRGYSLVGACRLLIAVASLAVQHRL